MNIAPLPTVQALEARVVIGPAKPFEDTRFVDLVQVDPRDSFGRQDSFASVEDAIRAARELSKTSSSPVAVVSGFMDFDFGNDPKNTPSYFLSQLRAERTGVLGGAWEPAAPGTRLGTDQAVTGVVTRDLSEVRYVMWNEAIEAIVDGATELRRDSSWQVLSDLG